jgi:hypothetical protein
MNRHWDKIEIFVAVVMVVVATLLLSSGLSMMNQ